MWWYENRNHIDVSPVYQRRGRLWKPAAKALLIDSILNGYDIPKIYVADFTRVDSPLNDKKKKYAIIDGKQRLEAIREFYDDKFPLAEDFEYQRDPSLHLGGLTYGEILAEHPSVAAHFDEFTLDVVSIVTDERGKIEDLFIRLNKTLVPLSGAEIRNAMPGVVPILVRELADHAFFTSRIKFGTDRYQDRDAAMKLLVIEHKGKFVSIKKEDLNTFTKRMKVEEGPETAPYRSAAQEVSRTLDVMVRIFGERDPLLKPQFPIPVYYWLVRECDKSHESMIRPFLEKFERERKEDDRRAKAVPQEKVDPQLRQYSDAKRSHNDGTGLTRMYRVLSERLQAFIESQPEASAKSRGSGQTKKRKGKTKA